MFKILILALPMITYCFFASENRQLYEDFPRKDLMHRLQHVTTTSPMCDTMLSNPDNRALLLTKETGTHVALSASIKHSLPEHFSYFLKEGSAKFNDADNKDRSRNLNVAWQIRAACEHNALWALPELLSFANDKEIYNYEAKFIGEVAALQVMKGHYKCFDVVFSDKELLNNKPGVCNHSLLWRAITGAVNVARKHENREVLMRLYTMQKDATQTHEDFIALVNTLYPSFFHFLNDFESHGYAIDSHESSGI